MTTKRIKKTADERIAEYQEKIKALKASKKNKSANKTDSITKGSEGIQSLLDLIDSVAKIHKLKTPDIIKVISRLKRTGLTITNSVRTKKDKNKLDVIS